MLPGSLLPVLSPASPRRDDRFDADWRFHRGDVADAGRAEFDDGAWRVVDTPHDWSIEDLPPGETVVGPFDPVASAGQVDTGWVVGGTGWYRKRFRLPDGRADRRVTVLFDGVYMDAQVWLNGHLVGSHPYGYTSFGCDLSDHLDRTGDNVLAVRVGNEGRNSRWYTGSGIYRPVRLLTTGPLHIGQWGVFCSTPSVSAGRATVRTQVELANHAATVTDVEVLVSLLGADGVEVAAAGTATQVPARGESTASVDSHVAHPRLWRPDSPHLYRAVVEVYASGELADRQEVTFGIRQLTLDATDGLRLNGAPLKLKGGCLHHDHGILGAAAIARAEERRVELLRAAGYNAVRTAHNPPSTAFLDSCDRLGLLVLDEAFDQWTEPKNPDDYHRYFEDQAEHDIAAMVRRDRNHPSVFCWSIGNEIRERFERPDLALRLRQAVLADDPTRPVTAAICGMWDNPDKRWGPQTDPAFEHLDLGGYNYEPDEYEPDHERQPARVMACLESFPSDAYKCWDLVERLPYVVGDFVWTAWDYLGEAGIGRAYVVGEDAGAELGAWPWHIAGCGDIDLLGRRKPQSYYREALWRPGVLQATVHRPLPAGAERQITRWGWPDVASHWTWPGHERETLTVEVYSSCDRVRLWLNNRDLGEQPTTRGHEHRAVFQVRYQPGELLAVGVWDAQVVRHALRTAGDPAALRLRPDRTELRASRDDLSFIAVEVVDAAGVVVPAAQLPVTLTVRGPASLAAVGNANPLDADSFRGPTRHTWQGALQAIVRPTGEPGEVTLRATAPGMPAGEVGLSVG